MPTRPNWLRPSFRTLFVLFVWVYLALAVAGLIWVVKFFVSLVRAVSAMI